jgi:hypothetical protein
VPPKASKLQPEEHIQLGFITQFVITLVKKNTELPQSDTGIDYQTG